MEDTSREGEIQKSEQALQSRASEIARQTLDVTFVPQNNDAPISLEQATRLPLAEIASLGAAFATLPDALRTVTQTVSLSGEGLLMATDKSGNQIALSALNTFKDGSGHLGSFRDKSNKLAQARFHEVSSRTADVTTTLPYDPTALFMAAALTEVNQKLDAIQETQREMFDYLRNKDKAELRGDLETLTDVLNNYRFNWNNAQYKSNKHILVQQIKNDAEKAIIQHRSQVEGKLVAKGLIHVDKDVRDVAGAVRDELQEYRLSVYLYSFASFLEVMLLENFDPDYLTATAAKIWDRSAAYRKLYTKAYDAIEYQAGSSVRAMALGGVSSAMGFLGKAIERTPVGDLTQIDETLIGAGKTVGDYSSDVSRDMIDKVADARAGDVRPFISSLESVSRLYNEPTMLLADKEAVYILPVDEG